MPETSDSFKRDIAVAHVLRSVEPFRTTFKLDSHKLVPLEALFEHHLKTQAMHWFILDVESLVSGQEPEQQTRRLENLKRTILDSKARKGGVYMMPFYVPPEMILEDNSDINWREVADYNRMCDDINIWIGEDPEYVPDPDILQGLYNKGLEFFEDKLPESKFRHG